MKKAVYIGTSAHCAEIILHNGEFELEAVLCETSRLSSELLTFCLVREVKLITINTKDELVAEIRKFDTSIVFIMYAFALRVPMEHLDGYKIYNIHPSDLPKYRGAHPTYWATVEGELKIGISIFEISSKLDEGLLISKRFVEYYIWENEADLTGKIEYVFPILIEDLAGFLNTSMVREMTGEGSYYPKVGRKEVYIDLKNDSPSLIYNKVRAEGLFGGAKLILGEKTFCIQNMLFESGHITSLYEVINEKLYIKYTDELLIVVDKYSILEEEFRFRDEK